jgi:WD40 repeat protein
MLPRARSSNVFDELNAHDARIRAIAFSPDGRYLLSSGWDRTVRMWELGAASPDGVTGPGKTRLLRTFGGYKWTVSSVALSPDSGLMITRSKAKEVIL